MNSSEAQWCYAAAGERRGPVTTAEMARLLAAGRIHAATPVWRRGTPRWQLLAEVEEWTDCLPAATPRRTAAGHAWQLAAAALAGALTLLLAAGRPDQPPRPRPATVPNRTCARSGP